MRTKEEHARYMRDYLAKNPAQRKKAIQRVTVWKKANPERAKANKRKRDLKARYNMTIQEWDVMFLKQGAKCAICGATHPGGAGKWHTDHCHSTGKIRGVLCLLCNYLLGSAKDNPVRLRLAANYLEK